MINRYCYTTNGVCSRIIHIEEKEGIICSVRFEGGCNGNLQGISRLVTGQPLEKIIHLLEGVCCDGKPTSCPDQLSKALNKIISQR